MSVRKAVQSFYELVTPALIEGKLDNLSGSVSLLVNVASKWGKTRSGYAAMVDLDRKYKTQGLNVLVTLYDIYIYIGLIRKDIQNH